MKTVTGFTEEMKLVKNGRTAPTTPMGGTSRPKFNGSNDTRPAGESRPNRRLKDAPGYIDQAPVYIGDVSHSRKWTNK